MFGISLSEEVGSGAVVAALLKARHTADLHPARTTHARALPSATDQVKTPPQHFINGIWARKVQKSG